MLLVYIGALVLAVGVLGFQLAIGHHGADADADGDGVPDGEAGPWTFVGSVRFWMFALLAFGLVGTLLTVFGFAGSILTAVIAIPFGLASGVFAKTVIKRLGERTPSSHGGAGEVVGQIGRVIVPLDENARGKVRVDVKGFQVDYIARATEPIDEGETVVVEDFEEGQVVVSRAPRELKG